MRYAVFLGLAIACNTPQPAPTPPVQSVRVNAPMPGTAPAVVTAAPTTTAAPTSTVAASAVPCESDKDCAIDEDRAACVAKEAKQRAGWVCGPAEGYCSCDAARHVCTRRAPEQTSCKNDEECDIQKVGEFEIPVKLGKPRAQKIKPCGPSHVPKCVESTCTITVYKC